MTLDQPRGKAPSIRDVARLAGVSHQTVSRVLNDHASLRPETRERVVAVMAELNYRPNPAARALVTSRSRIIGVLSAQGSEYGPASSIKGVEEAARARGFFVIVANVDGRDPASITEAVNYLLDQAVEGLVVMAPQVRVRRILAELNLTLPFVTMQVGEDGNDNALSVDQVEGARKATGHLLDLGHRSIYHLAGPQDWVEAEGRMAGFLHEMSARDVPTTAPILGDWTADFGYRAGRELLRMRDFTAIFSSNDQMALGLIHAVREAGLNVPGDVSIVGFDDIPEAAHFWPPLTTVRQDFGELGRRGVAVLLNDLTEKTASVKTIIPDLIVRESTAPPAF